MNRLNMILLALMLILSTATQSQSIDKHRVIVLTDITNEPDDEQSLVRFLLYSNNYDVEGIIATTSTHLRATTREDRIKEIVHAYGKVRDNLNLHEPGFPTETYLQSVVKAGVPKYGMEGVGSGMDTEGSEWIIKVVDRNDTRPVWISVWGGTNTLAQTLWKVRETRTPQELAKFISRLRVYTVSDQDNSGQWIRKEFPELFYIVSPGGYYSRATWTGISGEQWYRFATGADTTIVGNQWLRENIINNHGPLGAEYPVSDYIMESDSPTFFPLINNGLHVPERPDFGGWGGRYELYTPHFSPYLRYDYEVPETRPIWTDASDGVAGPNGEVYFSNHATIWRWREAYQNDFAARMDWCIKPYKEANHPPVARIKGDKEVTLRVGESITFDASESSDPDGDQLKFQWIHYPEAGDFFHWRGVAGLVMENKDTAKMTLQIHPEVEVEKPQYHTHHPAGYRYRNSCPDTIPEDYCEYFALVLYLNPDIYSQTKLNTTHIILQVTDTGTPALTRYERVIVNILP
jgi:hypothetical protein